MDINWISYGVILCNHLVVGVVILDMHRSVTPSRLSASHTGSLIMIQTPSISPTIVLHETVHPCNVRITVLV